MSEINNERPPRIDGSVPPVRQSAALVLGQLDALVAESEGVAGLHRNGDPAPWDELLAGGRFGEWLGGVEILREALAGEISVPRLAFPVEQAAEGVELIRRSAPPGELTQGHILAVVEAAAAALQEREAAAVRWAADIRAIKLWQEGEPAPRVQDLVAAVRTLLERLQPVDWDKAEADQAAIARAQEDVSESLAALRLEPGSRSLVWPDHVDLTVWLLDVIHQPPSYPAVKAVADMAAMLDGSGEQPSSIWVARQRGAEMLRTMAKVLMASERLAFIAKARERVMGQLLQDDRVREAAAQLLAERQGLDWARLEQGDREKFRAAVIPPTADELVLEPRREQRGEDMAAVPERPVKSPAAGPVVLAGPVEGEGNVVEIGAGPGRFRCAHLSRIACMAGQLVVPGQVVGYTTRPPRQRPPMVEVMPPEVRELVLAARQVAFGDDRERGVVPVADLERLDRAAEAFSGQVPWSDEPECTCGEVEGENPACPVHGTAGPEAAEA